jgi:hypothetical protein
MRLGYPPVEKMGSGRSTYLTRVLAGADFVYRRSTIAR